MTTAAKPKRIAGEALRQKIRTERGWAASKILGQRPWPKQIEMERAVFEGARKRTEVSGCVSSTKTFGAAMIALEWLMAWKPSRVFSLAPSFRQVDTNIWGYMQALWQAAKANGTPIGNDGDIFVNPHINLGRDPKTGKQILDWTYTGFSTDKPHNVHGIHGPHDLLILDDAQGIPAQIMDELENMTAGGDTRILMLYNRVVVSGPTFNCNHAEAALWNHVGISYADLVRARAAGFELHGALGADAVAFWAKKYGPTSSFYMSKVDNKYPKQEKDTLIPLDWIELAFDRKAPDKGPLILGGDIAMEGDDASALAPMRGLMLGAIEEWHEPDAMVTAGKFVERMKAEESHKDGAAATSRAFAFLDAVGLGGPVVNRIAEQTNEVKGHRRGCRGCEERLKVEAVKGSEEAVGMVMHGTEMRPANEVFKNKRSQIWWNTREALNPANANLIGLTRDDDLAAQLSCVKWRTGSDGRIEVEPKIGAALSKGGNSNWGIKRRLGFSPDKADAANNAIWGAARAVHGEFSAPGGAAATAHAGTQAYPTAEMAEAGAFMDGVEVDGGLD